MTSRNTLTEVKASKAAPGCQQRRARMIGVQAATFGDYETMGQGRWRGFATDFNGQAKRVRDEPVQAVALQTGHGIGVKNAVE